MRRSYLFRGFTVRSAGLVLLASTAMLSRLACSGHSTISHQGRRDAGADASGAAGHGGSAGLDAGAEADGFSNYTQIVHTDAWCAPPHTFTERAACCNNTPCYGQCIRHSPGGPIDCECATIVGGCQNGTVCCDFGCRAADAGCPPPP